MPKELFSLSSKYSTTIISKLGVIWLKVIIMHFFVGIIIYNYQLISQITKNLSVMHAWLLYSRPIDRN